MAVVFSADSGSGYDLWITNGTAAGTQLLKDTEVLGVLGNQGEFDIGRFLRFGSGVYFIASDPVMGSDPWFTDGTAAGTSKLLEMPYMQDVFSLHAAGDNLYFVVLTSVGASPNFDYTYSLWASDGTSAQTKKLADLDVTTRADSFASIGNNLLFTVSNGMTPNQLWISDGTTAGTKILRDFTGDGGGGVASLARLGDEVVFGGYDGTLYNTFWKTDGTAAGTVQVDGTSIAPKDFTALGDSLVFSARSSSSTLRQLWITDGTDAGTHVIKTIDTLVDPDPHAFTRLGDKIIFVATDSTSGSEVWVTDGTSAGTALLKNISASGSSTAQSFVTLGNKVLFQANDGVNGAELWVSDGTAAGTVLLKDLNPSGSGSPARLSVIGNKVYFYATDGVRGFEPWVTDGIASGTRLLKDIAAGTSDSAPGFFTFLNVAPSNIVLSSADVTENATNGTLVGTLSTTDFDLTDTHTFTLRSSASGRFALQSNKLVVADGTLLDFEFKPSHTVTVRATDKGGKFIEKAFTITLEDVMAENVTGDARANVFAGGAGNDTMRGGAGNDRLAGNGGDDTLIGGEGADTLLGGDGGDDLDGGAGSDTLSGGNGSDRYRMTSGDSIVEHAGSGVLDRVYTSDASLDLGALAGGFIEQAVLTGSRALNLTGNAAANGLWGNAGANTLNGKLGADYLVGGLGKDTFAFDTELSATNVDRIADFAKGDRICLHNAIFDKLGAAGALKSAYFQIGKADDKDDFILYDKATGALFYDADGNGAGAAVKFAQVGNLVALTAADFLVI